MEQKLPMGAVLADAAYGNGTQFRAAISELGLQYAVAIESSTTIWEPGQQPLSAPPPKPGRGAPPKKTATECKSSARFSEAVSARFALSAAWKDIGWRQGSKGTLRSRFAAVRVRPCPSRLQAYSSPTPKNWLLIEWPKHESEPAKYWLSTLPDSTSLKSLVKIAKQRWIIERDYEELKQELGLGHYEGRGAGADAHHHAALCIAAYGFLVSESGADFPPQFASAMLDYAPPKLPSTDLPAARLAARAPSGIIRTARSRP